MDLVHRGCAIETGELLAEWQQGNRDAGERLLANLYKDLRGIAEKRMRGERRNHTLGTTGLIHEAYLRMADQNRSSWENRQQFLGVAAQMMRRVLVDYAREIRAAKRGDGFQHVPLIEETYVLGLDTQRIAKIDVALKALEKIDFRQAKVVELHFFGGLTFAEAGKVLGCSLATTKREWTMARAWLHRHIQRRKTA